MTPLDPATEAALRDSIRRFGVLVPVVRDQHGHLLDGHHRARIADELGVGLRAETVDVRDDDHAAEIARTLNDDRRHVPREARREIVSALREEGHSLRAIADAVGVDERTVRRDATAAGAAVARVTGRDGKNRPANRRLISPDERAEITRRAAAGERHYEIATALNLSRSAVSRIVREAKDAAGVRRAVPKPEKRDQTARILKRIQDAVAAWREEEDDWWLTIPEAARRARVLADVITFLEERRGAYAAHGSKLLGEDKAK